MWRKRRSINKKTKKNYDALDKCTHPLSKNHAGVYSICNGLVALDTVNVQDALALGMEQSEQFSASLSSDFHKPLQKRVKTMEVLKKSVTDEEKVIYNLETLFSRVLVVGQQRNIEIAGILQFKLSPVPPALVDEYDCLKPVSH